MSAALSNFDTEVHCIGSRGEGAITGPRSATSEYAFTGCETQGGSRGGHECKSQGALENEILTPPIEAELVFVNQLRKEVAMLLAPRGDVYMEFECGGENVKALGPFLSPIAPIDQEATTFAASLFRSGASQVPNSYETLTGESRQAIPQGERELQSAAETGVELSFEIRAGAPLTVKAVTAAEGETAQREQEAASKKRHEIEGATAATAAKRVAEEEATKILQEEASKRAAERARKRKLARIRSRLLRQCRSAGSKSSRLRCERRVKKRFGMVAIASAHPVQGRRVRALGGP